MEGGGWERFEVVLEFDGKTDHEVSLMEGEDSTPVLLHADGCPMLSCCRLDCLFGPCAVCDFACGVVVVHQ
jgi:hypothetical protein